MTKYVAIVDLCDKKTPLYIPISGWMSFERAIRPVTYMHRLRIEPEEIPDFMKIAYASRILIRAEDVEKIPGIIRTLLL